MGREAPRVVGATVVVVAAMMLLAMAPAEAEVGAPTVEVASRGSEAGASPPATTKEGTGAAADPNASGGSGGPARPWGRPWVVVRAAIDNPLHGALGVELFPHERWSVGAGARFDRSGAQHTASLHWWPQLRRAGAGRHQFLLGIGGDLTLGGGALAGGFAAALVPSIDLRYLGRPRPALGFTVGLRLGVGAVFDARDLAGSRRDDRAVDHLGALVSAYAGFCFGAHR